MYDLMFICFISFAFHSIIIHRYRYTIISYRIQHIIYPRIYPCLSLFLFAVYLVSTFYNLYEATRYIHRYISHIHQLHSHRVCTFFKLFFEDIFECLNFLSDKFKLFISNRIIQPYYRYFTYMSS